MKFEPKSINFIFSFIFFSLFFLSSCSVNNQLQTNGNYQLQIAQNAFPQPYIQAEKNTLGSEFKVENEMPSAVLYEKQIVSKKSIKKSSARNEKIASVLLKAKKIMPQVPKINYTAAKKWKPNRDSFNVTWKDVVFMIVLLALLAILGGILHNIFGIDLTLALIITMGIGFVVICIYIWYLFNY